MKPITQPSSTEILQNSFNSDAIGLMRSYLDDLKITLNTMQISQEQTISVMSGINSYIDEYYEELGHKLSFSDTINLFENLGSPIEIVQSLVPETRNEGPAVIGQEPPSHSSGIQGIIDHPYIAGIVSTYVFLFVMNMLWAYTRESDFIENISSSLIPLVLPSFVLGLIIGYAIQKFYEDKVSLKVKFAKIVEDYQEKSISMFILFYVFSPPLFFALIISIGDIADLLFPGAGVYFALSMIAWPFVLGFTVGDNPKPDEISYLVLLRYKYKIQEDINQRIKSKIRLVGYLIIVIILIWNLIYRLFVAQSTFTSHVFSSLIVALYFGIIILGVIIFKSSSWKTILNDISRYENLQ